MKSAPKVIAIPRRSGNRGITANLDSNPVDARDAIVTYAHMPSCLFPGIRAGGFDEAARDSRKPMTYFVRASLSFNAISHIQNI